MCFRASYTSIYNIHLGFIKIESKIGREEARAKSAKKTGSPSPRRSIPLLRQKAEQTMTRRGSRVCVGEQTLA